MKYKLVLSDFDGTLRTSDDRITRRTVQSIADYRAAGGIFCVSTGRAFAGIASRLPELGLTDETPVLCCQGALFRLSSGKTLVATPMQSRAALAFLRLAESLSLPCQYYTQDDLFVPYLDERNAVYFTFNRFLPTIVPDLYAHACANPKPILKVLAIVPAARRDELLPLFEALPDLRVAASHPLLIEAVSPQAGKGNGLKIACDYFGVEPAFSVAVGDEQNDIPMLRAAGLGVAVENAAPQVRAVADYVTASNDRDGVAALLEKILRDEL